LARGAKPRNALPCQPQFLAAAVGFSGTDGNQAVTLERQNVAPSVVRSITRSPASALIVIGPLRCSLARIEYWVARKPLGARIDHKVA